jgi:general secretion pathway protein E
MGLENYLITSTVNGILAQRLVRRLCPHCREARPAAPEQIDKFRLRRFVPDGEVTLYHPKGCPECAGAGYLGRLAIVEFLTMSDALRRLVIEHAQARQIEELAIHEGMDTMTDDGMRKALAGMTTVEEVLRVTTDF